MRTPCQRSRAAGRCGARAPRGGGAPAATARTPRPSPNSPTTSPSGGARSCATRRRRAACSSPWRRTGRERCRARSSGGWSRVRRGRSRSCAAERAAPNARAARLPLLRWRTCASIVGSVLGLDAYHRGGIPAFVPPGDGLVHVARSAPGLERLDSRARARKRDGQPSARRAGARPVAATEPLASVPMAKTAGIVLAGGRSSRMGSPKAALEWHGSTLLRRVCGIVGRAVDGPIVVVRAPGQALPALPDSIEVVEDAHEGRGPLQGLAAGLAAVRGDAPVADVSSTDVPLLHPRFVARVLAALDDDVDVALPHVSGFPQPLAAAYRTSLVDTVERLIAEDRMRPAFLFEACRVRRLDAAALLADPALAALDPDLESVLNLNEPGDYNAARARPAPEVTVQRFGALRRAGNGVPSPASLRAATLGEAAAASGLTLDEHVVAALNGDQITRDPEAPLATGDTVSFLAADAGG